MLQIAKQYQHLLISLISIQLVSHIVDYYTILAPSASRGKNGPDRYTWTFYKQDVEVQNLANHGENTWLCISMCNYTVEFACS